MTWFTFATPNPSGDPGEGDLDALVAETTAPPRLEGSEDDTGQPDQPPDAEEIASSEDAVARTVLPFSISVLLHVGIVVLALFIVWSIGSKEEQKEDIIPIAKLSKTPSMPVKMRTTQTKVKTTASRRSTQVNPIKTRAVSRRRTTVKSNLIGVLGSTAGATNPFRSGVSTGTGLGAKFFGTGGNAYRIVYVIDASGSLMDSLYFVILELKRSINDLSPKQTFTVIFFQGDDVVEVVPRRMKSATSENKARVIEWIDLSAGNVFPIGPTNPVPALKLALQYKPELLFILSDDITGSGRYEVDQRRLLQEIENTNRGRAMINTIQFLYRDKLEEYGLQPTLKLIAEHNGGVYKFVDGKELGI